MTFQDLSSSNYMSGVGRFDARFEFPLGTLQCSIVYLLELIGRHLLYICTAGQYSIVVIMTPRGCVNWLFGNTVPIQLGNSIP